MMKNFLASLTLLLAASTGGAAELFPLADVWMHGHLHCANDYTIHSGDGTPSWSCRVVANPLGYLSKGEQAAFRENLVIEV